MGVAHANRALNAKLSVQFFIGILEFVDFDIIDISISTENEICAYLQEIRNYDLNMRKYVQRVMRLILCISKR